MRNLLFLFLFAAFSTHISAQSGRVEPEVSAAAISTTDALKESTAAQLFTEANNYSKKKFAEFETKKISFSSGLRQTTLKEQKQLAAKYAAALAARENLPNEDFYYLGMLHWLADNFDQTLESFQKFLTVENPAAEQLQTARSIIIVIDARRKKFVEAEKLLAEYLKAEPRKLNETARMQSELAENYQADKDFARAAPHAEEAYAANKNLLKESSSRARGLDNILDAALTAFRIYRDGGERAKAENTLEDLRKTAAAAGSSSMYFTSIDENIKYLINIYRKSLALDLYSKSFDRAEKDFAGKDATSKALREDVARQLKRREQHYKLIGDTAPELSAIAGWFPGQPQTLARLRGKVVLLDFWATWCVPCVEAFPSVIEWQQTFEKEGFKALGMTKLYGQTDGEEMSSAAEMEYLQRFRQDQRIPYDFVIAKDNSNQVAYGANSIPTAVLIDRKGVIRYIEVGSSKSREEEIRQQIIKLLAEK